MTNDQDYRGWKLTWLSTGPPHDRWFGLAQRDGWADLKYDGYRAEADVVSAMKRDVDKLATLKGVPMEGGRR